MKNTTMSYADQLRSEGWQESTKEILQKATNELLKSGMDEKTVAQLISQIKENVLKKNPYKSKSKLINI